MKHNFKIHQRQTKTRGVAFDLYFKWKRQRHEPVLGYNLTPSQAYEKAVAMVRWIQSGEVVQPQGTPVALAFDQGVKLYWQMFTLQERVDVSRAETIIEKSLRPFFGDDDLACITVERGLAYAEKRKTDGVVMGTIRRELQVLNSMLNTCVELEKMNRNRLKRIFQFLPKFEVRERVCTKDELVKMKQSAAPHLWRFIVAALNTGLRVSLLLAVKDTWLVPRQDGWWLVLPPARSSIKGNPKQIPLNDKALWALSSGEGSHHRIFWQWNSRHSLKSGWVRLMQRTGIEGLTIHLLRHTFATALQNLDISYEAREALLGHSVKGQTKNYSHGGVGWDKRLRKAVEKLPRYYRVNVKVMQETGHGSGVVGTRSEV